MKTYQLQELNNKRLISKESIKAFSNKQALYTFMSKQGYSYWDGLWLGNPSQVKLVNGSIIKIERISR